LTAPARSRRPDAFVPISSCSTSNCRAFPASTRHARSETQHIPLVAATGYSHARQLELAREVGFDRIVVKPCDPDQLAAEIDALLRRTEVLSRPADLVMVRAHKNG
jgi:DNA-binding response OmpR family regulator